LDPNQDLARIAILDHSPELGGAETSILTLCRHLDKSRFHVTVILPQKGPFSRELAQWGIPVKVVHLPPGLVRLKRGAPLKSFLSIPAYFFYFKLFLLRLCVYLKKNHFHLVLTNTVKAHLYGSLAAFFCSLPVAWRFHDILSPDDFSPVLIKSIVFFGKIFPRRILAVSNTTKDYLTRRGLKDGKIEVILNGIDHEALGIKGDSNAFREEFKIGAKARVIGCVGRIVPHKGQRFFLLSIPQVIRAYPDLFFLIVGDVFHGEDAYKKDLLKIIKEKGLDGIVRFAGFRTDIGDVMKSLDILVFPSVAPEAFPLTLLEAMSLGRPVVASNIGGVSEIVDDGETGLLVEPGRPDQISERILFLLSRPEERMRIGHNARRKAQRISSLTRYVKAMENAFRETMDIHQ
jgi:glycosyltransferase involved in cell wall biosynthesis